MLKQHLLAVAALAAAKNDDARTGLGDRRALRRAFCVRARRAGPAKAKRERYDAATRGQRLIQALDRDRCPEANPNPIYQSGNKASESRPRGLLETARASLIEFPASR